MFKEFATICYSKRWYNVYDASQVSLKISLRQLDMLWCWLSLINYSYFHLSCPKNICKSHVYEWSRHQSKVLENPRFYWILLIYLTWFFWLLCIWISACYFFVILLFRAFEWPKNSLTKLVISIKRAALVFPYRLCSFRFVSFHKLSLCAFFFCFARYFYYFSPSPRNTNHFGC